VPGSTQVPGTYAFSAGIYNPGPGLVKDASIAFSSSRSPDSLIAHTGGVGEPDSTSHAGSGVYRYEWDLPDILQESSKGVWFDTPIKCTFAPGFDSSREATPTLLDSETTAQVVKIRVKPVQPFRAFEVGIDLQGSDYVRAELVKGSDKPALRNKSSTWISWWRDNPEINRVYEFTVRLKLTNLIFPSRVDFVPWMQVYAYESRQAESWSSQEWHGSSQPDPDISIWDVTIEAPGTSESSIEVGVATAVAFWHRPSEQLRADITIAGLPFLPTGLSEYLYKDGNGMYSLQLDDTAPALQCDWVSQDARSVTLWLSEGSHTITVPQIIGTEPGVRYYCEENRVHLSQVSAFLGMKSYSHAFNYLKQYLLQIDRGVAGTRTPKWVDAGSNVTIWTDLVVNGLAGVKYDFVAWTGSIDTNRASVSFVMEKPMNVTAIYAPNYSQVIFGGVAAVIIVGAIALVFARRSRKDRPKADYDLLLQKLETLKASGSISEPAYARLRAEYEKRKQQS